jgi:gliding motility-associated-like protein
MDNQFDDLFRKHLEHAEVPAPEGVWEAVSGQVATQAAAGTAGTALSGAVIKGAAALLIAGASYLAYRAYTTQPPIKVQAQPQTHQTQVAEALPPKIAEEAEATIPTPPVLQSPKAPREAIASQPTIECNGVDIADYEKSLDKTEEPSGKHGSSQEIAANTAEQPCAWTRSIKPRITLESVRSVVFMSCTDSFAAGTLLTWFCNGTEIGKGQTIRYTVLNHRTVQMNLKVQFPSGCTTNQEFGPINVEGCDVENNLLIPNVFTPNADGINDPYRVLICGAEQFQLSIFDRTGRRLFSTSDPESGWDGRIHGKNAPEGMYIAKLRYRFYGHPEQEKTTTVWLKGTLQH